MHDVTSDHNPPQEELNHPNSQTSTVHTSDAHSSTMTEAGMKEVNENENETTSPEEGADNNKKDLEGAEEEGKKDDKRYIPSYKKPDAALTFPEKMMSLMKYAEKAGDPETFCVAWLPDGKSFVVRHPDDFTRKVLPKFFKATKFSSFTRKLYRWGFRQVNRGIGPDDPIIFGNECFQRNDAELMTKMRSITAASTRKQDADNLQKMLVQKRALDTWQAERDQKRLLLTQIMHQQQLQQHLQQGHPPPQQQHLNFGGINAPAMYGANQLQGLNFAAALTGAGSGPRGGGPVVGGQFANLGGGGGSNQQFGNLGGGNNNGMPAGLKPFEVFAAQQNMTNSNNPLLGGFQLPGGNNSSSNGGNKGSTTTADIVNAAINALRYAP